MVRIVINCLMTIILISLETKSEFLVERFLVYHDRHHRAMFQTSIDHENASYVKIAEELYDIDDIVIDFEKSNTVMYILDRREPNVLHVYGLKSPSWNSTFVLDNNIITFDKSPKELVFVMANDATLGLGIVVGNKIDNIDLENALGVVQVRINLTDRTKIMFLTSRQDTDGRHNSKIEVYDLSRLLRTVIGDWPTNIQMFEVDFQENDIYLVSDSTVRHCKVPGNITNCYDMYNSDCVIRSTALCKRFLYFACRTSQIFRITRASNHTTLEIYRTLESTVIVGAMKMAEEYVESIDYFPNTVSSLAGFLNNSYQMLSLLLIFILLPISSRH